MSRDEEVSKVMYFLENLIWDGRKEGKGKGGEREGGEGSKGIGRGG